MNILLIRNKKFGYNELLSAYNMFDHSEYPACNKFDHSEYPAYNGSVIINTWM